MTKDGSTSASQHAAVEATTYERMLRDVAQATGQLLRDDQREKAIRRALATIGRTFHAETVDIYEFGTASNESQAVRRFGWRRRAEGNRRDDSPEASPSGAGVTTGLASSRVASGAPNGPLVSPDAVEEASPIAFTMTIPITTAEQTWGTLQLETTDPSVRWTRNEVALLEVMAHNFGAVLAHDPESDDAATTIRDAIIDVVEQVSDSGLLHGAAALVDVDGQVLFQNDAMTSLCRETPTTLNGRGGFPAVFDGDPRALRQAIASGASLQRDAVVERKKQPVRLQVTPIRGRDGQPLFSLCWLAVQEATANAEDPHALRLRRRVRAERALVEASQLLVASDACDYEEMLRIVGEATRARYAYLVIITPNDVVEYPEPGSFTTRNRKRPIHLDTYTQYEWFSPTASTRGADPDEPGPTFAVPILSSEDQLYGYLGIEYETDAAPGRDEDARILSVLGDMLCTYLQRQISEEALRRSEQRYRHFVDTISEAIWRVELSNPVDTTLPVDEQVDDVLAEGIVVECNAAMANVFGLDAPHDLVGRSVAQIVAWAGRRVVEDLVEAAYRLRNHEVVVTPRDGRARYFVVNTVGVQDNGRLTGLWGSCTEVTDRVELERRMVTALERQQQRIGRDLHDRVSQQLAGTRMLAQNLADRYFSDDLESGGRKEAEKIISYVQEAAQHVSDLQRGVMPVQVERDGLAQALTELTSRTDAVVGVDCVFVHDGTTDVYVHEVKLQLYRIAQEATRNALTHADPSLVEIELCTLDDDIVLRVEDDGAGFDVDRQSDSHGSLGLHSMRYRARAIGAHLDIDTQPGSGTVVRCTVPRSALDDFASR